MSKNSRLPNFQNSGIMLRILVIVNVFGGSAALLLSSQADPFFNMLTALSTVLQPILLLSILLLYLLYPVLKKWPYWHSLSFILLLEIIISVSIELLITHYFSFGVNVIYVRTVVLATLATLTLFYYFHLQQRAYSPAIAEARLQALQARIRPHFLFNSMNAVLSLIRSQPKRAESALEDLSDLFRVLMAENRELVPLKQEINLCKQYLNIESLRLEERLKVNWQINHMPQNALVPPLILQPLIENAVYHGIEPIAEGGEIMVTITHKLKELQIKINNPYHGGIATKHMSNKMALKNIKERLALHFDLAASLRHSRKDQQYTVVIRMPYET